MEMFYTLSVDYLGQCCQFSEILETVLKAKLQITAYVLEVKIANILLVTGERKWL
jgi:hypothetical protein